MIFLYFFDSCLIFLIKIDSKLKNFMICWLKFVIFDKSWFNIKKFHIFLTQFCVFYIKIEWNFIFSLFFDSDLWFLISIVSKLKFAFRMYSKLNGNWIFIICWLRFAILLRIISKLKFAFRIDSTLMIQLEFAITFDLDLWFLIRIVSKLRFACRVDSKWTQNLDVQSFLIQISCITFIFDSDL